LDHTSLGDPLWSTSRGHRLTDSEQRFVGCDAAVTPVVIDREAAPGSAVCPDTVEELLAAADAAGGAEGPAAGGDVTSAAQDAAGGAGAGTRAGTAADGTRQRLAALAMALMGRQVPLAAGRTERTATPAQRRALAVRDRGCIIPGCGVVAEACQVHHLTEWSEGGASDPENLVLLCWAHHRQVDLRLWSIEPAEPVNPGGEPLGEPPHLPPGSTTTSAWPGNNGSPWVVRALPRTRWRT
jgi:hypothetical protein